MSLHEDKAILQLHFLLNLYTQLQRRTLLCVLVIASSLLLSDSGRFISLLNDLCIVHDMFSNSTSLLQQYLTWIYLQIHNVPALIVS